MGLQKRQKNQKIVDELLPIPDKLYLSISEVSSVCRLKPHVLRYWEQEFSQLKPIKRRNNRRYYQRKDVILIRHIQDLLYNQGFTIEGAKAKLEKKPQEPPESKHEVVILKNKASLLNLVSGLEQILADLEADL